MSWAVLALLHGRPSAQPDHFTRQLLQICHPEWVDIRAGEPTRRKPASTAQQTSDAYRSEVRGGASTSPAKTLSALRGIGHLRQLLSAARAMPDL